jgi:SAM-dependent methyltransferase
MRPMVLKAAGVASLMKRAHAPVYASRLRELTKLMVPYLRPGDRVLDVGCGSGFLGRAILDSPTCPKSVLIRGLERVRRGGEAIPVEAYDGETIPYADNTFEVVILADVLHHEQDPHHLIGECARVARRFLIIKDHKIEGPFAQQRIALMDWAANSPYGVPCLYRYNTTQQWSDWHAQHGFVIEKEWQRMRLYPLFYHILFGGRQQYMAVLRVPSVSTA